MVVGSQRYSPANLTSGKRPVTNCTGGCLDRAEGLDG